jgi:hypothetical protein
MAGNDDGDDDDDGNLPATPSRAAALRVTRSIFYLAPEAAVRSMSNKRHWWRGQKEWDKGAARREGISG